MRGTRFVFAGSIVAFLVIALITILETSGYHVQWKPFQIRKVAGLSILSTTRASVFLDEEYIGTTPIRRGTMTPGTYHIRVTRMGFIDWEADIRIVAGQAKIIGPLDLLPTQPETMTQTLPSTDIVLPDPVSGTVFVAHAEDEHIWTIRNLTHQAVFSITSIESPIGITSSADGGSFVIQTKTTNLISTGNGHDWIVSPVTQPRWASISNEVLFGLRNQHLVVLDALQHQETILEPATSIATGQGSLWSTASQNDQTVVQVRDESLTANPKTIAQVPGDWRLQQTVSGQLFLREEQTSKIKMVKRQQVGGLTLVDFDSGDDFWQTTATAPIVWRHGSEIMTLNQKQRPLFVDRWSNHIQAAWWYVDRDILLWADQEQVVARSILPQTGDRQLGAWPLPAGSRIVLLDQKDSLWVTNGTTLIKLHWPKP